MIAALISGTLFRSAESRMSKNGKAFASANVKVKTADDLQFVRVMAFSESAMAELLRLQDGDSLSVQGALKAETYQRDGETKLSLSLFADAVLALRQPPKERKPKQPAAEPPPAHDSRSRTERQRGSWSGPADGPDDMIPF